jgi:hypothetical protein
MQALSGIVLGLLALGVIAFALPEYGASYGFGFLGAALVIFMITVMPWEELFTPRAPRVQAAPAVVAPRQGCRFFDGWGEGASKHSWLIAGFIFAGLFTWSFWTTLEADEKVWPMIQTGLLFAAAVTCFLVSQGKLGKFLAELVKDYKAFAVMTLALFAAMVIGRHAYEEGYNWLTYPSFWAAIVCAVIAGLAAIGMLIPTLKAFGEVLGKAFGFGYHPYLSLTLWAVVLMAGGTFMLAATKHDLFDSSADLEAILWDPMRIVIGAGFTLLVIGLLVFKKK